jgi:hypothetical protein
MTRSTQGVLPGRARGDADLADPQWFNVTREVLPVDPVSISEEVPRRRVLRKGLDQRNHVGPSKANGLGHHVEAEPDELRTKRKRPATDGDELSRGQRERSRIGDRLEVLAEVARTSTGSESSNAARP